MQRSKQQALMFLLGAVLVGGVLGFSADRVLGHDRFAAQYGPRARFYDELGLSRPQRATLDSLAVEKDCEIRTLLKPMKPQLDSVQASFKTETRRVYTPAQLAKVEQHNKEIQARHEAQNTKEPKRQCSVN